MPNILSQYGNEPEFEVEQQEAVMEIAPTICAKCKWCYVDDGHENFSLCSKNQRTNYVTGQKERWTCAVKNTGNCPDYEEVENGDNKQ